ncbi:MAG: helix-turn-helix transcriptional regulator [Gemmatimonadota bacterium]|nr:helix-turn-helix transcriptional regulator [Gemmatimonadota bacterium]
MVAGLLAYGVTQTVVDARAGVFRLAIDPSGPALLVLLVAWMGLGRGRRRPTPPGEGPGAAPPPLGALLDSWDLSPSEAAVAHGLIEGRSLAEIAQLRHRSHRTVRQQASAIYRKVGVDSRAQLAARVIARLSGSAPGAADRAQD